MGLAQMGMGINQQIYKALKSTLYFLVFYICLGSSHFGSSQFGYGPPPPPTLPPPPPLPPTPRLIAQVIFPLTASTTFAAARTS